MIKIIDIGNVYKDGDEVCLEVSGSNLWSNEKKKPFLNNIIEIKEIKTNIGGELNDVKG